MKLLLIPMLAFLSLQAEATVNCSAKIVANGKTTESKIDLKEMKTDQRRYYEAERDGYIFQAEMNDPAPNQISGVVVMEKATKRRSVSRYGGMKPQDTGTYLSTALVLEEGDHPRVGQIICRLKK